MKNIVYADLSAAVAEKIKEKGQIILAIDGRCGSGKSTLTERIAGEYSCSVIHMDDFFLRPEQRTEERLAEPGGNIDRERFMEEVLIPLKRGEQSFCYRRFDCSKQKLTETVRIEHGSLVIVEGVYSCYLSFRDCYDLTLFLSIDEQIQRARILERSGPQKLERFIQEWIPKEEDYFKTFCVKESCDFCIDGSLVL